MDFNIFIPSTTLAGAVCYGIFMYFRHWRPAVKSSTANGSIVKEVRNLLRDILIALNAQNEAKKFDTEQIKNLKSMVANLQGTITELRVDVAKHGE